MKVVDVRTHAVANPHRGGRSWIFVRLATGEGVVSTLRFSENLSRWENGYIIPPAKPGLGVGLNEEVAAGHPAC